MKSEFRFILLSLLFVFTLLCASISEDDLFIVVGTMFAFTACLMPIRRVRSDRISIESLCLIGITAYSVAVPLHHLVYQDYDPVYLISGFVYCIVGIYFMVVGNFIHYARNSIINRPVHRAEFDWVVFYRIGWVVFITGLISSFLALYLTVGLQAYFSAGYAGRALLKRGAGPVELGLYHAVFGFLMIALAGSMSKYKKFRNARFYTFILLFTVVFVSYVSFLGIRRPSFFLLFSLVVLLNFAYPRFNRKSVLAFGLPLVLLLAIFASFRQVLSDQGFFMALTYVSENISFEWLDLSVSELGAPFRVLLDVTQLWSSDEYRFGYTFLQSIPNLLPSAFGIDVQSLSEEYTVRNFSSAYISIGGNMGFFPIAEGYVNADWLGIAFYMACLGYLVSAIQFNALSKQSPMLLMCLVLTPPWFVFLVRTDMASFAKVFFYSIFMPYVFALLLEFLRSNIAKPK